MAKNTIRLRRKARIVHRAIAGLAAAVFLTFTVSCGYMNLVGRVGFALCLDAQSETGIDFYFIYERSGIRRIFDRIASALEGDVS